MKKATSGFTIVELLIVIVAIAILASISVVAYTGVQSRARDSKRANDIAQIKKALLAYEAIHGGVVQPGATGYTKPVGEPTFGGFDVSSSASWLIFLRGSHGNMPTDPENINSDTTSPLYGTGVNRLYTYYCYAAGHPTGLPDSPAVYLGYRKSTGSVVVDRFPVASCLTTIPS